jgi:hypothetical protein
MCRRTRGRACIHNQECAVAPRRPSTGYLMRRTRASSLHAANVTGRQPSTAAPSFPCTVRIVG